MYYVSRNTIISLFILNSPFSIYIGSNDECIDFRDCCCTCEYCGAFFLLQEQHKTKNPPKFFLCCKGGTIQLPLVQETHKTLNILLNCRGEPLSTFFQKYIRTVNSMFSFTSFGANIDSSTSDSHGPYVFKISGQIHHLMGSLLPLDNDSPKFTQLYIYDTVYKIQNRMSLYIFDDAFKNLT